MYKKIIILFILSFSFLFLTSSFVMADVVTGTMETNVSDPSNLTNPLGTTTTVPLLIGNVITAALGVVGSLALLMFIYGGFTWMLAAGNDEAIKKGKGILLWATIGLIVIFGSYSLVNFLITSIK